MRMTIDGNPRVVRSSTTSSCGWGSQEYLHRDHWRAVIPVFLHFLLRRHVPCRDFLDHSWVRVHCVDARGLPALLDWVL